MPSKPGGGVLFLFFFTVFHRFASVLLSANTKKFSVSCWRFFLGMVAYILTPQKILCLLKAKYFFVYLLLHICIIKRHHSRVTEVLLVLNHQVGLFLGELFLGYSYCENKTCSEKSIARTFILRGYNEGKAMWS